MPIKYRKRRKRLANKQAEATPTKQEVQQPKKAIPKKKIVKKSGD